MDQKSQRDLKGDLVRLIRQLSYREGDFTLVSGKKSRFYIDMKATTLHPEGAFLIGEVTMNLMSQLLLNPQLNPVFNPPSGGKMKVDAVGGLTLGADPLATAISLAARARHLFWPAFIVRKEPKGHGTSQYIEGRENLPPGAHVLVLEDVVTTGGSSLKAIARLREAGYHPVATLTVVDRQEGGEEAIRKEGVDFFALTTLNEIQNF